jgi:hypothetical protein
LTFGIIEYLATNPTVVADQTYSLRSYGNDLSWMSAADTEAREDGYVEFVDGESEFYEGSVRMPNRWTFDPYTGILHFGMYTRGNHSVMFYYRRRKFKVLSENDWDYYKSTVTGKVDTSKIVLKPSAVCQFEVVKTMATGTTGIELVQQMLPRHDWWAQKLVKGSIKLGSGIIADSAGLAIPPVEVKFVDGYTELQNTVETSQLIPAESGYGLHTFYLDQIDSTHILSGGLTFDPVIEYPDPIKASQFVKQVETEAEITVTGDWWVDADSASATYGKVVVASGVSEDLRTHNVKYKFEDTENGVDKRGLYSIDYNKGIIYFASPVAAGATITFNVTMYSAFYNLSEVVEEQNIKSIEEKAKKIELEVHYAEKFLKEASPQNPRPRFVKVGYSYYKTTNESLRDLEPYFSPICKDLALRVITKDLLGSL